MMLHFTLGIDNFLVAVAHTPTGLYIFFGLAYDQFGILRYRQVERFPWDVSDPTRVESWRSLDVVMREQLRLSHA